MLPFGPISRADLVAAPRKAGFDGPFSGRRHQFMIRGQRRLWIPNPHSGNIGRELLARLIRQAGISRNEWERL